MNERRMDEEQAERLRAAVDAVLAEVELWRAAGIVDYRVEDGRSGLMRACRAFGHLAEGSHYPERDAALKLATQARDW